MFVFSKSVITFNVRRNLCFQGRAAVHVHESPLDEAQNRRQVFHP